MLGARGPLGAGRAGDTIRRARTRRRRGNGKQARRGRSRRARHGAQGHACAVTRSARPATRHRVRAAWAQCTLGLCALAGPS